jgi:nucleotidyltransferase/DNA polymerase involved in DNA repair
VAGEVKRDIKVGEQAAAGQQALRELLDANKSRFRFPNFAFNRTTTTANVTLDALSEKLGKNVMDKLTRASQSGQDMARLIDTLPAVERSAVLRVLNNPQEWMVIPREGRGAAVNVLAPENRNKLRK